MFNRRSVRRLMSGVVLALTVPGASAYAQMTRITALSQMTPNGSITWDQLTSESYPNGNLPDYFVNTGTLGLPTGISGLTTDIRISTLPVPVFEMRTDGVTFNSDFAFGTRLLVPVNYLQIGALSVSFNADVDAVGVALDGNLGETPMRATAFDVTGAVLDEFVFMEGAGATSFLGFRSASRNIRRVEYFRGFNYSVPFSNGVYVESGAAAPPTVVPEPSSFLLLGAGVSMLTVVCHRRRNHDRGKWLASAVQ